MDNNLAAATEQYVKAIKDTDIYKEYSEKLAKLKEFPDKYRKVNEFRQRNFEMQNSQDDEDLFEKVTAFEEELEVFREDPVVDEFMRAELGFCRLMQEINLTLTEEVNFDYFGGAMEEE